MSIVQWASGTPQQILLHVRAAIHACKQMKLDANFTRAQEAVMTAELNLEIAKESYATVCSSKITKAKGNKGDSPTADSESLTLAKVDYEKAAQAVAYAKLAVTMEGVKAFKLYVNLLSDEA